MPQIFRSEMPVCIQPSHRAASSSSRRCRSSNLFVNCSQWRISPQCIYYQLLLVILHHYT